MKNSVFTIIEEKDCPYYQAGDEFKLSGNAILLEFKNEKEFITAAAIKMPFEQPSCRKLIGDLTNILINHESLNKIPESVVNCRGCTGSITLEYKNSDKIKQVKETDKNQSNIGAIANLLGNFSIFQSIDEHDLKDLIPFLKLRKFGPNDLIIRKGNTGKNLFIIVSGRVEVVNEDGISMSVLEKGEVFGEMSLISGNPVGATIKVLSPATVLSIKGEDFLKVLNKSSSLQMYFTRLLTRRLAESNIFMSEELASGMSGQLSEIPPPELFQSLNVNEKTGLLNLSLSRGEAKLSFMDGNLISAEYDNIKGKEAFFEILKEKKGRFKFVPGLPSDEMKAPVLGYFMGLLIDGLRRIDEESKEKNGKRSQNVEIEK
ncbi:MAG: cyclic nucleotide-binding domain-containing protein [Deltaproteobacteria bacterium]|nr:cyclic nucleotide-binding domain-containing protein [Deltaproteobacteria bacterium]